MGKAKPGQLLSKSSFQPHILQFELESPFLEQFITMPTPRRSARVAAQDTSPDYTDPPESGRKRKSETTGSSPSAKRGKKAEKMEEKEQKTIEETLDV